MPKKNVLTGLVCTIALSSCQDKPLNTATDVAAITSGDLPRFVLYADRSVRIGDHVSVQNGDVGVALETGRGFGPQVVVGDFVDGAQTTVYAHSVQLGMHGHFDGVESDSLTNSGSSVTATAAYPFSAMPHLPLAHQGTPATTDLVVAEHQTVSISPGDRRSLTVNGTLQLTAGAYSFQDVTIGACGKLVATGTAVVRINGVLTSADGTGAGLNHQCASEIGVDASGALSAKDMTLEVSSSDPAHRSAVMLGQGTRLHALLSSPHATTEIGDHAQLRGAVAASDIRLASHVAITLEDGFAAVRAGEQGSQQLTGYFGKQSDDTIAPLLGPVAADAPVYLSIGLPVRDPVGLQAFIDDVSRPGSPNYRNYLSTSQFNALYGATDADYQSLRAWASSGGLTVRHDYASHLLLGVSGTAAQVEALFHANLVYRQTDDASHRFVAVDREPSVDLNPRVLWVTGFDQYRVPKHMLGCDTPSGGELQIPPVGGTSADGYYSAQDLRNAYLGFNATPCMPLTGAGQTVAVVMLGSFSVDDIRTYIGAQTTGISPGTVGGPDTDDQVSWSVHSEGTLLNPGQDDENAVDIESVIAMAPQAKIRAFEGELDLSLTSAGNVDDLFEAIANDASVNVATNSWVVQYTPNLNQSVSEMAARGVSLFTVSGDYGNIGDPGDSKHATNQTIVGGTELLDASGIAERTWNNRCPGILFQQDGPVLHTFLGDKDISGGGVMDGSTGLGDQCGCYPTPYCCGNSVGRPPYQDLSIIHPIMNFGDPLNGGNGASKDYRNFPDVAGVADNVDIYSHGSWAPMEGTSIATPVWAGFTALVNEYAHRNGIGPLGFANPTFYAMGMTAGTVNDVYSSTFVDIQDGVFNQVPNTLGYPAIKGYDLVTGWGAPRCGLIQQLGTINPTAPQTFNTLLVHLATGHSGVDDDDPIFLRLYDQSPSRASYLVNSEVKVAHQSGWDSIGNVKDLEIPLPMPLSPADVGGVDLHLGGDSTWDVTGVQVALASIGPLGRDPTYACISDLSGRNGCDVEQPGCNTNDARLTDGHFGITELDSSHRDAYFDTGAFGDPLTRTFGGCPAWGGSRAVTLDSSLDGLEFIIDTGDDDLDDDAILSVDLYDPDGFHLSEPSILVHRPSVSFDDQSQWDVRIQFTAGLISMRDIGSFRFHLKTGDNSVFDEEWNLEGLIIYGLQSASPWQHTCLYSANGDPLHHFDAGDSSATKDFPRGTGCL